MRKILDEILEEIDRAATDRRYDAVCDSRPADAGYEGHTLGNESDFSSLPEPVHEAFDPRLRLAAARRATDGSEMEEEFRIAALDAKDTRYLLGLLREARKRFGISDLKSNRVKKLLGAIKANKKSVYRHIADMVHLFDSSTPITREEIDWPLIVIIAVREIGINRRSLATRSNRKVISAGRDTHPKGRGGFDNLFKLRNRFPSKVKSTLMSVRKDKCRNRINPNTDEGFRRGRENTCPALIPQKYLLAGAAVNVTQSFFAFQRKVRAIFDDPDDLLSDLNQDAKRIWTAITFARPGGGVNAVLKDFQRRIDAGDITGLNAIVSDESLFESKPFARRAAIAAAQAWMLEGLLPPSIRRLFRGKSRKLPADYSCVRPIGRIHEISPVAQESGMGVCRRLPIAATPQPCRFYTIKRGVDARGLIHLAGRAYGADTPQDRVKLAQSVNNHPYNRRFWRSDKANGLFPLGRISFNPRFSGDIERQAGAEGAAPRGHSFATIFIPPPPNWVEKIYSSCAS